MLRNAADVSSVVGVQVGEYAFWVRCGTGMERGVTAGEEGFAEIHD